MEREMRLSTILISLIFSTTMAHAAPVMVSYSWAFKPGAEPAVANAMTKYYKPDNFKGTEGAIYINQFQASASPITHSFAVFYENPQDQEDTFDSLSSNPDYGPFVNKLASLGRPVATTYYSHVKSFGPSDASARKWTAYSFNAQNPELAVKAYDEWRSSKPGKAAPGNSMLLAARAGAPSGVTHIFVAFYESRGEYESWIESVSDTKEYKKFMTQLSRAGSNLGASMGQSILAFGSTENVASFLNN